MKSHELVERINNGEIKDGTKFIIYLNGNETERIVFDEGKSCLKYEASKDILDCSMLLSNDFEFEIVEEVKGRFKPEKHEVYWFVDSYGKLCKTMWYETEGDLYHYNYHNCFRSEEEAQECLDYTNALKEAEKPFVDDKYNYFIIFDPRDNQLGVDYIYHWANQGTTYLGQDKQVAQAFIDKWKKQILKYEFDVWE